MKTKGTKNILILVLSLVLVVIPLYYAFAYFESPERIILFYLPGYMVLWLLLSADERRILPLGKKPNIFMAIFLSIIIIGISTFFYSQYRSLLDRIGYHETFEYVLAGVMIVLVIFMTWKTSGRSIPIVAMVFYAYAVLGPIIPGFLHHGGLSIQRLIEISALEFDGIFGSLPQMGISYIVVFSFLAAFAEVFGVLEYVIQLSSKLVSRMKYGLPQVTVIASLIFGTFSGSAAANAAGVGSFTIPTMKKFGIPGEVAAGIEGAASSGGQVMPPVMGVAAFIMAGFLAMPYVDIMVVGFLPAFLFYGTLVISVYFMSRRLFAGNTAYNTKSLEMGKYRLPDGIPFAIAIGVLLFVLINYRMAVLPAGTISIITFLASVLIYRFIVSKNRAQVPLEYIKNIRDGILAGAKSTIGIMFILGTMGVIAKILVATGLSQKLAFGMVDVAGGNLWLLILLIVTIAILFGIAVSTTVGYILLAMIATPALKEMGIAPLAAHFTVFYLMVLSAITPPVAIATAVTSQIAGASFWKTSAWAMRFGIALPILSVLFISTPQILALNLDTLKVIPSVLVGLFFVAYSLTCRLKFTESIGPRVLIFLLGMACLFYPTMDGRWIFTGVGILLLILLRFFPVMMSKLNKVKI